MSETPKLAGVIGWPITHSLSPLIHTLWAHRAGVNGYYIPVAAKPSYDEFAGVVGALKIAGFAGVNVTLPHKSNALQLADDASEGAKKAGAANMLTFHDDHVYADNSDIFGFAASLDEATGGAGNSPTKRNSALVLGAGGAARGVILGLRERGIESIAVANRTRERADELVDDFQIKAVDWAKKEGILGSVDILVNTTSLGMSGQPPLEISLEKLSQAAVVADIVYTPLQTPLLAEAASKDHQTANGLSMLMHQAVPGFQTWFGAPAKVDAALRDELIRALERRNKE
ncbi:MAG: shikimate dehydrogenase [Pseudomonadota bacterium]